MQIDAISIDDERYDELCLNCRHWLISGFDVICEWGNGYTNPTDFCPNFVAQLSLDDDLNAFRLKKLKMDVWKKSL